MIIYCNAKVPVTLLPETFSKACGSEAFLFDPAVTCDIGVSGDRILAVALPGEGELQGKRVDLGGRMVFPGFVDAHTHIDKAYSWNRAPNRSCDFLEAGKRFEADKSLWNEDDLYLRGNFSLRCAWAHGTVAMRTHLDASDQVSDMVFSVYNRLRAEWAGRISLQAVALTRIDFFTEPSEDGRRRAERLVDRGAEYIGAMPIMNPDLDQQLDRLMALAKDLGLGLDLHVDENNDPSAECLRRTAQAVLRNEFPYPVACGHCSSLALQEPDRQRETLALVKSAGIKVISLPMCNLFLQDRKFNGSEREGGTTSTSTPLWRGVTLYHEMLERGITLACASDNVRDAYFAYGDYDMFETYVQSLRIGQLESRLAQSPQLVTSTPAEIMNLRDFGTVEPRKRAELVVFPGRSFNELLSRPFTPRQLISGEEFRQAELPDFSELG